MFKCGKRKYYYFIILYLLATLLLGIIYFFYNNNTQHTIEYFTNLDKKWPDDLVKRFIEFQRTMNPNIQFDMNIIQQQASASEAEELLKSGYWTWSPEVIKIYTEAIQNNTIIKTQPGNDIRKSQTIYNQHAIMEKLSYKTKEGSFLLHGVNIGTTKNMPDNLNNYAKCAIVNENGVEKMRMEKTEYTGYDSMNGGWIKQVTPIADSEIPNVVNGFRFKKCACNPCVALNTPTDYSCPFELNVGYGYDNSSIWNMLWDNKNKQ